MTAPVRSRAELSAALNHVGICVPDIRAAVEWYGQVFGLRCIMGPRVLRAAAPATAETASILGPTFRSAYQAHLLTADGTGLELFQFVEPPVEPYEDGLGWERRGPWHICFTYADVAGQVDRVVAAGGTQVSPVSAFVPGRPYLLVYLRDPWGTVLELMSHSYADVFGDWPQPRMTARTEWGPGPRQDGG